MNKMNKKTAPSKEDEPTAAAPGHVHSATCSHGHQHGGHTHPTSDPPSVVPPKRDIGKVRLARELEVLSRAGRFEYDHHPEEFYIIINKIIKIEYGKHFPF